MKKILEKIQERSQYFITILMILIVFNMKSCDWYKDLKYKYLGGKEAKENKYKIESQRVLLSILAIDSNLNYKLYNSLNFLDTTKNIESELEQTTFIPLSLYKTYPSNHPDVLDSLINKYKNNRTLIIDSADRSKYALKVLTRAKIVFDSTNFELFISALNEYNFK
jgi:hypothetical protein